MRNSIRRSTRRSSMLRGSGRKSYRVRLRNSDRISLGFLGLVRYLIFHWLQMSRPCLTHERDDGRRHFFRRKDSIDEPSRDGIPWHLVELSGLPGSCAMAGPTTSLISFTPDVPLDPVPDKTTPTENYLIQRTSDCRNKIDCDLHMSGLRGWTETGRRLWVFDQRLY